MIAVTSKRGNGIFFSSKKFVNYQYYSLLLVTVILITSIPYAVPLYIYALYFTAHLSLSFPLLLAKNAKRLSYNSLSITPPGTFLRVARSHARAIRRVAVPSSQRESARARCFVSAGRRDDQDAGAVVLQRHHDVEEPQGPRGRRVVPEDLLRALLLEGPTGVCEIRLGQLSGASGERSL